MDLWSVRNQALRELDNNLKQENALIEEGFGYHTEFCVTVHSRKAQKLGLNRV